MKVAINTTPLFTEHSTRGIGSYTENLINGLKKRIEIVEFQDINGLAKVDLVHYPWFDLFFHTLSVIKKYPTIITIHDLSPLKFSEHYPTGIHGKINFWLQNLSLFNVKRIITDSTCSKKDIIKILNIPEEKIEVVYLAASKEFKVLSFEESLKVKKKFNLPDNFILYAGDVNYVKNLPFLIKGFKKFLDENNKLDYRLVLVGNSFLKQDSDHPELQSLKEINELIKQFQTENLIIRPGYVSLDELVGFYNLATVYIQPSFYEGFGLPVLEAMACGTVVICSNKGSLPEVAGDAAAYFDPQNIDQFVKVLNSVLVNSTFKKKLIELGLKQSKKFSWENVAEQTLKVYEQVLLPASS